jgi:ATP phosphoribosyltransferase
MRLATKYVNLTHGFFARNGIAEYRIVESLGATEGAPAAGLAEAIVDITTTGATLAANALKILDDGVILKSEANLVASLRADWNPTAREAVRAILARLGAAAQARAIQEVKALPDGDAEAAIAELNKRFGAVAPFGHMQGAPLVLHVPKKAVFGVCEWLMQNGAATVATTNLDDVFDVRNPLYERLTGALRG